ncbi:non-hydrolyzing UDP-N-acetylglucosamine 2-epimerase [Conexibacter woesei]|uniref:non-hydrolyzing UDP-N-acetylglucosamine 2-epimerase n=1 Tax=Conexibacter woesei TaxID=191495 RepID=UPI00041A24A8|nr:UDP-N-acetylglucosamine 2-epimerase (non-hydrolyzing) [Conexibacter woesei]
MKIVTVIGNRPQFVKAAAVSRLLREAHDEVIVHTGQHHDDELSAIFFEELQVPRPEHQLHIAGGTNTEQTARMLAAIGPLLADEEPDVVLVYGDTNSTVAGGLAAAQAQIPVVHVEAGMRSFDRRMPEELNRVLTDHLSDLLLVPSETALRNLEREAVAGEVVLVGDVMVDVSMMFQPRAKAETRPLRDAGVEPGAFVLCTAHRAGNVDDPDRLRRLVDIILAVDEPLVLPLHPRTGARLDAAGWLDELAEAEHVRLAPPLGYMAFTALLTNARRVLTDSGGVQKEAYFAGVPCVTLRDTTEWVETIETGWNVLVDLDREAALTALQTAPPAERPQLYGDGHAGERVVAAIDALRRA